jgi:preprotein translocase subunit SecB
MGKNTNTSPKQNGSLSPAEDTEENKMPESPFTIQRIYVKNLSLESPNSPLIFQQEWKPTVDVQLNASTNKLAENIFEVKLSLTVTAKVQDKVAFLAEIDQAGIFSITLTDEQLNRVLGSYCPNILFPFAREGISDLITRGGFPPLYLAPINFDALYEQQVAQQKENADKQAAETANPM